NGMRPLDVYVDFYVISGLARACRRNVGYGEVRRGQRRQSELRREHIRVVLNRQRTAPVCDPDGLARAVKSFRVQAREIVCRLDHRRRVAATRAGQSVNIQVIAFVSSDWERTVAVLGIRLGHRAVEADIGVAEVVGRGPDRTRLDGSALALGGT